MEKGINQWERWFWRSKMTKKCGYYLTKPSLSIRAVKEKAFCTHPRSLRLFGTTGRPAFCEGDMGKCVVPRAKRIV